jgi:hypothetical protein
MDGLQIYFDFFLRNVALKINPNGEFNKDLEIPETCSFFHPNFCFAKTSLNPDVIRHITQALFTKKKGGAGRKFTSYSKDHLSF